MTDAAGRASAHQAARGRHPACRMPHAARSSAPRTPRFTRAVSGQAMVELAIFGSLALVILSALINYGLTADYNQKSTMESFRVAMAKAAPPPYAWQWDRFIPSRTGGGSVTVVDDRAVPNPLEPFGMGSETTVSSSNNVIWDFRMHKNADWPWELPTTHVVVNGKELDCSTDDFAWDGCQTAGLRFEFTTGVVPNTSATDPVRFVRAQWWLSPLPGLRIIDLQDEIYGASNVFPVAPVLARVQDSCDGEILSYDSCCRRARMMTDFDFCQQECFRGRWSVASLVNWVQSFIQDKHIPTPCPLVCGQIPFYDPIRPWYARDQYYDATLGRTIFPRLEELFAGARNLGLQPSMVRVVRGQNSLTTSNTPEVATTAATLDWRAEMDRQLLYRQPWAAYQVGKAVQSTVTQTGSDDPATTTVWSTPWN